MFATLFSPAAAKAWVSGVVAAVLTPLVTLLSDGGDLTARTILLTVLSGLIALGATFGTTNTPPGPVTEADLPGEHEAPLTGL